MGVGPLDPSQPHIDRPVLTDNKDRTLPAAGTGSVQPCLQDLLQLLLPHLFRCKPADGPTVQDRLHNCMFPVFHLYCTSCVSYGFGSVYRICGSPLEKERNSARTSVR